MRRSTLWVHPHVLTEIIDVINQIAFKHHPVLVAKIREHGFVRIAP